MAGKPLRIQLMLEKCTEGHGANGAAAEHQEETATSPKKEVFYKTDGSRFDLDTTIKLNVMASYQISFNFRPVVRIERLEIMGEVKVPTETARDIESVTYMTYFDTKAKETSKKRERSKIHISLDLGEHGHLNFDIQAKFYAEKNDNHVSWGNPLHQIELEASCADGEVKVSKTTFR